MAHREAKWPLKCGVIQRAASGPTPQVSRAAILVLVLTACNSLQHWRNKSLASRKVRERWEREKKREEKQMTRCCGYVCVSMCVCFYVGVAVALLSSLESVLIKKDWFYSECVPEGSKEGSDTFECLYPYTLLTRRVLYSTATRFFKCESWRDLYMVQGGRRSQTCQRSKLDQTECKNP